MQDGPGRRVVKRVARFYFDMNLAIVRAYRRVRGHRPYLLGGDCQRCAACCEAPAMRVGLFTWYLPTMRRLFVFWHRHVNGFELTEVEFHTRVLTFQCTHFDVTTRRCDSYESRPGMCRDYPRVLLYQPHPELLPGCGYRPVARDAKRFLGLLEAQSLTTEQRERLRKKLFLE